MSDDLISRQAAIDAIEKSMYENPHENEIHRGMHDHEHRHFLTILMGLPSAQPATNCSEIPNGSDDTISRQAAIDAVERIFDRCEEIEAHLPEGDPDRTGYKMYPDYVTVWKYLHQLPSAQPEMRHCVNCGRTVNNGGWYKDGRTRCPIEEHYALPKDGFCHLWEKRNVTDDDYPERREE